MNATVLPSFRTQADACARLDSPLYASLLTIAADDIEAGGPTAEVVATFEGDATAAAVALRLMGGLHRLVLNGSAPTLASHFPTAGGEMELDRLAEDYRRVAREHTDYLIESLDVAPQTNEAGRSALLLPGIAAAVGDSDLPIHLREIGTSAGLNLIPDLFTYRTDQWEWAGAPAAPTIEPVWTGGPPFLADRFDVRSRVGCDTSPIDVADPSARLRLLSFIWPDQAVRFQRARAAIEVLRRTDHRLDAADAADWLAAQLSDRPNDGLMVVQHSVMWQYLPPSTASDIDATLDAHGRSATESAPLAHVRFEPVGAAWTDMRLIVTRWPGGEDRTLARGHPHGSWVEWFDDEGSAP